MGITWKCNVVFAAKKESIIYMWKPTNFSSNSYYFLKIISQKQIK